MKKRAGNVEEQQSSLGLDEVLTLLEAAHSLQLTPGHIYNMGVRGELVMSRNDRLKKWVVTKASVDKYKKAAARGA